MLTHTVNTHGQMMASNILSNRWEEENFPSYTERPPDKTPQTTVENSRKYFNCGKDEETTKHIVIYRPGGRHAGNVGQSDDENCEVQDDLGCQTYFFVYRVTWKIIL